MESLNRFFGRPTAWIRATDVLIGMFFVAAAYFKLTDSFFGAKLVPIGLDMLQWLDRGFPLPVYREFLQFMLPYSDVLGTIVILSQGIAGVCLVFGFRTRAAGWLLLFVQLNVLAATFNGPGFITLTLISVWLALYYVLRTNMNVLRWRILTYSLILIGALLLRQRWFAGDPWIGSFVAQRSHFLQDVMSTTPELKRFVAWSSGLPLMQYVWAGVWWLNALALLAMCTQYRLYGGALWLLIWLTRTLVWLTALTGEGTLWVLSLLAWVVYEEQWQRNHDKSKIDPRVSR